VNVIIWFERLSERLIAKKMIKIFLSLPEIGRAELGVERA
jgi:hypothetical protein